VNTRVFSYDLPEDGGETLAAAQTAATEGLGTLVETLYAEHGEELEAVGP
jgi:predicted RNase H-like HicB family nuclease